MREKIFDQLLNLKTVILIFLLFLSIPILSNDEQKITDYIKSTVELNKQYKLSEKSDLLNKVMPGEWIASPHCRFTFKANGELIIFKREFSNQSPEEKKGIWSVNKKNELVLKIGNSEYDYKVNYYKLTYNKRYVEKYTFKIIFIELLYMGDSFELVRTFN